MNFTSIGDLAQTFQSRRYNVQIKSDLARLAQELASGQKSDLSTAVAGDFSPIAGLERDLKANSAYKIGIAEAGLFATAQQTALATIQDISSELGSALISAGLSESSMNHYRRCQSQICCDCCDFKYPGCRPVHIFRRGH